MTTYEMMSRGGKTGVGDEIKFGGKGWMIVKMN